jgi:hypothetical protein
MYAASKRAMLSTKKSVDEALRAPRYVQTFIHSFIHSFIYSQNTSRVSELDSFAAEFLFSLPAKVSCKNSDSDGMISFKVVDYIYVCNIIKMVHISVIL